MNSKPKVIIDTDAGIDDAIAILMLLHAHRSNLIEIMAITTVNGNTSVENVNVNIYRILESVQMFQIPVFSGSSKGLVSIFTFEKIPYFGMDGFGDVIKDEPPTSLSKIQKQHASLALLHIVEQNPNEIILVALGPLTNIALSMNLNSNWSSLLRDFYVMGGNINGIGNYSLCGEFNFYCDPEAAKVVLDRTETTIKLTPWETCANSMSISFEERRALGESESRAAKLINFIESDRVDKRFNSWLTCDQLTAAWVLDDYTQILQEKFPLQNLILNEECLYATVELNGNQTRGQMVIDHYNKMQKPKNIKCMRGIRKEKYLEYLKLAFF
ncbi:UNVERIFIED_CONTAM: hypothetical protein RMT77_009464 [Armadillidium vulgare]